MKPSDTLIRALPFVFCAISAAAGCTANISNKTEAGDPVSESCETMLEEVECPAGTSPSVVVSGEQISNAGGAVDASGSAVVDSSVITRGECTFECVAFNDCPEGTQPVTSATGIECVQPRDCEDEDGDGYDCTSGDCDESSADVNPGASETPYNGIDDDCDVSTPDDDLDGDGYPLLVSAEVKPDCDDNDAGRKPYSSEVTGNGIDDDCDALTPDSPGDLMWALNIGGPNWDQAESVTVDSSGNAVVTGRFNLEADFAGGAVTDGTITGINDDIFVAKYDPAGKLLWARADGGISDDRGNSVDVGADGSIYVAGKFDTQATFGAGQTAETTFSGTSDEIFIAKYTPDGKLIRARSAGGTDADSAAAVAVLADGSAYLAGSFRYSALFGAGETNETTINGLGGDVFLARYAPDGSLAWVTSAGGGGFDNASDIALAADGGAFIVGRSEHSSGAAPVFGAGETNETSPPGEYSEVFLARYNPDGTLAWAKTAGGAGSEWGLGVAAAGDGGAFAVGTCGVGAVFGAGELNETTVTGPGNDVFLARYAADGSLVWVKTAGGSLQDIGRAVAVLPNGDIAVAGEFDNVIIFESGGANETMLLGSNGDGFIALYDADGNLKRATPIVGSDWNFPTGIAAGANGSVFISGRFNFDLTFGAGGAHETSFTIENSDGYIARFAP